MTGYAQSRERSFLPRGWTHLAAQFAIWMGFYVAYQAVRGHADRSVPQAFWHGTRVIELQKSLGLLFEPTIQHIVESSQLLIQATSMTYWLSQFVVVGVSLLFVYFAHHDRFYDFRNWLITANLIGLIGYIVMPTAPPRMFPEWGFTDTLAEHARIDQGSVAFAANPFAAMPSLHAMDALIVGLMMASLAKTRLGRILWLVWPAWVSFCVMGTGNHFWMDCAVGMTIALVVGFVLLRGRMRALVAAAVRW